MIKVTNRSQWPAAAIKVLSTWVCRRENLHRDLQICEIEWAGPFAEEQEVEQRRQATVKAEVSQPIGPRVVSPEEFDMMRSAGIEEKG